MKTIKYSFYIMICSTLIILFQNFDLVAAIESRGSRPNRVYLIFVSKTQTLNEADFNTRTLTEALAHIANTFDPHILPRRAPTRIEIKVDSGTYSGESLTLDDSNLKLPITIRALDLNRKPRFIGENVHTFLKVKPSRNLFPVTIRGLKIEHYNEAISLTIGDSNSYLGATTIKGHRIENCEFKEIGNRYAIKDQFSYAVIRVQNVANSYFIKNKFIDINSDPAPNFPKGSLLHAFYLAHHSSNNTISHNTFLRSTGDWIRIRNSSHRNTISFNSFADETKNNKYGISSWFDKNDPNPNHLECPSFRNIVKSNDFKNVNQIKDYILPTEQSSLCPPLRQEPVFIAHKNIDISQGQCRILPLQKCDDFELKTNSPTLDYLSQEAQSDPEVCSKRPSDYYSSCTRRSHNPLEVYRSSFEFENQFTQRGSFGKGCVVDLQNCPRMAREDFVAFMDHYEAGHTAENVCEGRVKSWYSSCSRLDTSVRFARTTYVQEGKAHEFIAGHGCIVKANYCPRMKNHFSPDGLGVDFRAEAHISKEQCRTRAHHWMSSCSKGGAPIPRRIETMFYQNGELVEKTVLHSP
ncbi:MAG: right-handed parallel beta-helix repeat-containing protein [Bdellovibrionales bacterium]|nr:right-handed parallel beta-helix repeat-containing protein [Bdellovibrionales bacterium]